jgi:uncharacterized protein YigE (DUF2233 family)
MLRDKLQCRDALFLNAKYSSLDVPAANRLEAGRGLITMIAVLPR